MGHGGCFILTDKYHRFSCTGRGQAEGGGEEGRERGREGKKKEGHIKTKTHYT